MLDSDQDRHAGRYRITAARGAVQRRGADLGGCVRADDCSLIVNRIVPDTQPASARLWAPYPPSLL